MIVHTAKAAGACVAFAVLALAVALAAAPAAAADADTAPAPDTTAAAAADDATAPGPDSHWPALVGAQLTAVRQTQTALRSPYAGRYSLFPGGDTQPTETYGIYLGWSPLAAAQFYLDLEKFNGAGVSNNTGLGSLTNGDSLRQGNNGLRKRFYIARRYLRLMRPLGSAVGRVAAAQEQVAGSEATTRLELKVGTLAVNDDFDRNRYAGGTRNQFMSGSLWQQTAWDFAADTRGYSDGVVLGYVSPAWSLRYGAFLMPKLANGQPLVESPHRARGDNLELTLSPWAGGTTLRLLAYRNIASMGDYREALAIAALAGRTPDIVADDRDGRRKYGYALNLEQPLADEGETGLFARLGWNDGHTESFAFAEVDRQLSLGAQLAGAHWKRSDDRLGAGLVVAGVSAGHRSYLAAGGSGFVLGDGRLNYGKERVLEIYYRVQLPWPFAATRSEHFKAVRVQLSPDLQYVRNPGYNRDRGPVRFWALRFHVEY